MQVKGVIMGQNTVKKGPLVWRALEFSPSGIGKGTFL